MYLIPEDGQSDQNMQHVLTGSIKFVLVNSNKYIDFEYYVPQRDKIKNKKLQHLYR
jgi:hypothetical protein